MLQFYHESTCSFAMKMSDLNIYVYKFEEFSQKVWCDNVSGCKKSHYTVVLGKFKMGSQYPLFNIRQWRFKIKSESQELIKFMKNSPEYQCSQTSKSENHIPSMLCSCCDFLDYQGFTASKTQLQIWPTHL